MTKLSQKKVDWIMRELDKNERSVYQIAKIQGVIPRRIRQLREYRDGTGQVFRIGKEKVSCQKPITHEEIIVVNSAREKYPVGATMLEKIIDKEYESHIPHNRIQKILEAGGFTTPLGKKVKRNNWTRFERKHSNSMWHTDWTQLPDKRWFIAYEDDASRKAPSWSVFADATSEHSIEVLKRGIERCGKPRSILTGHDCQFYANEQEGKEQGKTAFQIFLEKNHIRHILGRVYHPQTNGKAERLFGTVKAKLNDFESIDDLMNWYNDVKPHMSLDFDNLETPSEAFVRKMHHSARQKMTVILSRR